MRLGRPQQFPRVDQPVCVPAKPKCGLGWLCSGETEGEIIAELHKTHSISADFSAWNEETHKQEHVQIVWLPAALKERECSTVCGALIEIFDF